MPPLGQRKLDKVAGLQRVDGGCDSGNVIWESEAAVLR